MGMAIDVPVLASDGRALSHEAAGVSPFCNYDVSMQDARLRRVLDSRSGTKLLATHHPLPPVLHEQGLSFDSFELIDVIYSGPVSSVYKALVKGTHFVVALKVYFTEQLSSVQKHNVSREVGLHLGLDHPNIIWLFAAFEEGNAVVLVQEYAGKGDLFQFINRHGGKLSENVAIFDVVRPFLQALDYMHARGIVHRDIKPENVLFLDDRTLKLADFGVAVDSEETAQVTRAGTPNYMPPEVLRCTGCQGTGSEAPCCCECTCTADIWATGIMVYEMLVGFPPEIDTQGGHWEIDSIRFPKRMSPHARVFIQQALSEQAAARPTALDLLQQTWLQADEDSSDNPEESYLSWLQCSEELVESISSCNLARSECDSDTDFDLLGEQDQQGTSVGTGVWSIFRDASNCKGSLPGRWQLPASGTPTPASFSGVIMPEWEGIL